MTNKEALMWFIQECENGITEGEYQAFSKAIDALELQIPKEPQKHESDEYSARCPNCYDEVSTHWIHGGISYCEECGQCIKWGIDND